MQPATSGIRRWWRAPRRLSEREEDRRVTFLELFYDLVYVVVVAEIGHFLAEHVDMVGVLEAAFLFILVWIAWVNGTLLGLALVAMPTILLMALLVGLVLIPVLYEISIWVNMFGAEEMAFELAEG